MNIFNKRYFVVLFFFTLPFSQCSFGSSLPNFLLRPMAMHYCESKVSLFAKGNTGKKLCHCVWGKIKKTKGEKEYLLENIFSIRKQKLQWKKKEAEQLSACISQLHAEDVLQKAEIAHPELINWIHKK